MRIKATIKNNKDLLYKRTIIVTSNDPARPHAEIELSGTITR